VFLDFLRSQKGRWLGCRVKSGETRGSNPRRRPETALGIFLKNKKIRASKSPETVDATGFAPVASKLFGYDGDPAGIRTCTSSQKSCVFSGFRLWDANRLRDMVRNFSLF
jgi:hypothetical protein